MGGGSDHDGLCVLDALEEAIETDHEDTAKQEGSDRTTTATQNLSVTTQSKDGALSPSLSGSLRDAYIQNNSGGQSGNSSGSPSNTPSSPPPSQQSRQGRTIRGRTPGTSRRVSASNPNSAAQSMDRSTLNSNNPNKIGTIGICASDSKARSKPSRNILNRLVGKDNEFDVIPPAFVSARAFITSQSADAHLILFRRIFEIAQHDTKQQVLFRHIDGTGFEVWVADAHKGQALERKQARPLVRG